MWRYVPGEHGQPADAEWVDEIGDEQDMPYNNGDDDMVIAKRSDDRYLHPEGQFKARCIDIIDLGDVETTYNGKKKLQHKVVVRFWCGCRNEDGDELYVGQRMTNSLGARSTMLKFLTAWRGKDFTEQELDGFELDNLIDAGAYIQVRHNNGYANIDGCLKLPKGEKPPARPPGYVRVKDRPDYVQPPATPQPAPQQREPGEDDDLPF